jgi:hypothetical protein
VGDTPEHQDVEATVSEAARAGRGMADWGGAGLAPASAGPGGVLALQRMIGNAGVSRLVAERGSAAVAARPTAPALRLARLVDDPIFQNPYLETIYEANKPGTPEQLTALRMLDTDAPLTGVWSGIKWGQVARSAGARIYNPNMMAQGVLGTCGPATILNFIGTNDPQAYIALVIEVFREGKAKGSKVNSKLRGTAPQPGMDALDWMMMSAVQDISNDWYDFYGTPEGQDAKREGTTSGDQRWMYKKFAGAKESETIDTPKYKDVLPAAKRVNGLVGTAGVSVNMHLSASVLQNAASAENKRNHVIRLLKPISITENADDSKSVVEFDAFTWGQVFHWKGTVNQFIHMMWAFTIVSKTKGVI